MWAQDANLSQSSDGGFQGRVLRLSLVEGDVSIQHGPDSQWLDAVINAPLVQGDRVWVGGQGRAEIEFDDGSYVRLASNSVLEIQELNVNSNGRYSQVFLSQGLGYFNIRESYNDAFRVTTPSLAADADGGAHFRLAVDNSNDLVVFRGMVHVNSSAGDVDVRPSEFFSLNTGDTGHYSLGPAPTADGWDRWNFDRDNYLVSANSYQYVPSTVGYGVYDLDHYGRWVYQPGYGYVWAPNGVDADWVPYSYGRWVTYPDVGYTWVSYEPWGWLPYHYGSWAWINGFGWGWCPGARFAYWSPARVFFFGYDNYWGWCPYSPFDTFYGGGFTNINFYRPRNFFFNRMVVVNRNNFIHNVVDGRTIIRNHEVLTRFTTNRDLRFSRQPQIQRTANSEVLRPASFRNGAGNRLASDTKGWSRADTIRGTGQRPPENLRMGQPFGASRNTGFGNREAVNGNATGGIRGTNAPRNGSFNSAPMNSGSRSETFNRSQTPGYERNTNTAPQRVGGGSRETIQTPAARTPYSGNTEYNRSRNENRAPVRAPAASPSYQRNERTPQRQAPAPRQNEKSKSSTPQRNEPHSSAWQAPARSNFAPNSSYSYGNARASSSYQPPARIERVAPNSYRSVQSYNAPPAPRNNYRNSPMNSRSSYSAPEPYAAPRYNASSRYSAPRYEAPQYQAPRYQAPQYQAPRYQAPRSTYSAPSRVETPHYSAPSQHYSAPSQHYSAPTFRSAPAARSASRSSGPRRR